MQGQSGAIGSFTETLGFEHGSTSSDMVNSPSNRLPDYTYLNPTNQEGQNVNMWTVGEPSSSSVPNQANQGHTEEPRPDCVWPSLTKSCPEPPSCMLSLGDRGASSSSSYGPFGLSSDPCDVDDNRLSRKRKVVELTVGQSSSGAGSSNMFQRREGGSSSWCSVSENPSSDPTIPRLGLSIGETSLVACQQVEPLPANNNNQESDVPGLRLNLPSENSSIHPGQPVLRVPTLRRNIQSTSRWSRNSSSRTTPSPNLVISEDWNEPDPISDHFVVAPPGNIRSTAQSELNWSSTGGGDVTAGGTRGATSSRPRPSSGLSSSYSQRRLSALLRRSLFSETGSEGGEGEYGDIFSIIPPALSSSPSSTSSQGVETPPGPHHQPYSRSSLLLGRQLEGAFNLPYLSRTMMPGSERRGRLMSEIRNVLDLMRRGESLRFEDLDESVFHGIADIRDRHRDMRLDIDNMSYEELLALEERIGNVNTGLTEETISKHLKQKPYVVETDQRDAEPCCICQEGYKDGDDLGTLECGHDFHHGCIKQWLQHKNMCPICKSTGFAAT